MDNRINDAPINFDSYAVIKYLDLDPRNKIVGLTTTAALEAERSKLIGVYADLPTAQYVMSNTQLNPGEIVEIRTSNSTGRVTDKVVDTRWI